MTKTKKLVSGSLLAVTALVGAGVGASLSVSAAESEDGARRFGKHRAAFIQDLTDEQRAVLEAAKELPREERRAFIQTNLPELAEKFANGKHGKRGGDHDAHIEKVSERVGTQLDELAADGHDVTELRSLLSTFVTNATEAHEAMEQLRESIKELKGSVEA